MHCTLYYHASPDNDNFIDNNKSRRVLYKLIWWRFYFFFVVIVSAGFGSSKVIVVILQTVDKRAEPNNGTVEPAINISDDLQDELCQIWDMSMNSVSGRHLGFSRSALFLARCPRIWWSVARLQEVVCLLREFKAVDILTGVISRSCAPRATVGMRTTA